MGVLSIHWHALKAEGQEVDFVLATVLTVYMSVIHVTSNPPTPILVIHTPIYHGGKYILKSEKSLQLLAKMQSCLN